MVQFLKYVSSQVPNFSPNHYLLPSLERYNCRIYIVLHCCAEGDTMAGDPTNSDWLDKVREGYDEVYNLITTAGLRVYMGATELTFSVEELMTEELMSEVGSKATRTWSELGAKAIRTKYLRPRLVRYITKTLGVAALDAKAITDLVVDHVIECNQMALTVNVYVMTLNKDHRLDYRILNALVVLLNSPAFNFSYISDDANSSKYDAVDNYIRDGIDIPNEYKSMMREALGRIYNFLLDDNNKTFGNADPRTGKFEIDLDEEVQNDTTLRNHLLNIFSLLTSLFKIDVDTKEDDDSLAQT